MSINIVKIKGNLTKDPEIRHTPTGKAVCNLSIANNREYTANKEKKSEVSYFDVEVWGNVAENCEKYLKKGRSVIVEGRLKQDRWEYEGKSHNRVKIIADNILFLSSKRNEIDNKQVDQDDDLLSKQIAETLSRVNPGNVK